MTDNQSLILELAKRILGNIGAVPGDLFGTVGATTSDYFVKNIDIIEDQDEKSCPAWGGELNGPPHFKIVLSNLGSQSAPEFFLIIWAGEDACFAINVLWADSVPAIAMYKLDDQWIPLSVLHMLNLTAAFELLTQEGISWMPISDSTKLLEILANAISKLS